MICPTCQADPSQAVVTALVNRNGNCSMEQHPCPTCGGTGDISKDQFERLSAGSVIRNFRVGNRMTIFEFARIARVTPLDVSDYERGSLPTDPEHAAIRDKLYAAMQLVKEAVPA